MNRVDLIEIILQFLCLHVLFWFTLT